MKIKALNNQSLFDIALQETGTIESMFEIAQANASKITSLSEPVSEGVQVVTDSTIKNNLIVNYYKNNNNKLSSASKKQYLLMDSEGNYLEDTVTDNLYTKEY